MSSESGPFLGMRTTRAKDEVSRKERWIDGGDMKKI